MKLKYRFLSSIFLCGAICLNGCAFSKKPWLEDDCAWYTQDNSIYFVDNFAYLIKDGQTIETYVGWCVCGEISFYQLDEEKDGHRNEDDLLSGPFSYDGKTLTFRVEIDRVYNFTYETITFKKRKLTPEDEKYLEDRIKRDNEKEQMKSVSKLTEVQ